MSIDLEKIRQQMVAELNQPVTVDDAVYYLNSMGYMLVNGNWVRRQPPVETLPASSDNTARPQMSA